MKKYFRSMIIGVMVAVFVAVSSVNVFGSTKRKYGSDTVTRATPIISSDQVGIHDGRVYSVSGARNDLATMTYHWVYMVTPSTGTIHLQGLNVWTDQDYGALIILEEPANVGTSTATTLVPYNRNRQSDSSATMMVYNGVTLTPDGLGEAIDQATASLNTFTISTVATDTVVAGDTIVVNGSTGNDGYYIVTGAAFSTPTTTITVSSVTDDTDDGVIFLTGRLIEANVFNGTTATLNHQTNSSAELMLRKDAGYLIGILNTSATDTASIAAWALWSEEGE